MKDLNRVRTENMEYSRALLKPQGDLLRLLAESRRSLQQGLVSFDLVESLQVAAAALDKASKAVNETYAGSLTTIRRILSGEFG